MKGKQDFFACGLIQQKQEYLKEAFLKNQNEKNFIDSNVEKKLYF